MIGDGWVQVDRALEQVVERHPGIGVWLRDDDAVEVTPALERLDRVCSAAGMPVLLAVIPVNAKPDLGAWIAARPSFTPCQHGYAHINHAVVGARACELGGERPLATIEAELHDGRARLKALFGARLSDCLVPPWNRIVPDLIPRLPALGFDRLSTFGPTSVEKSVIRRLDADLDIIDWRNGRVGRSFDDVARKLAGLIAQSRDSGHPIGLLTHHLAHDATAWTVLEEVLTRLAADPRVYFAGVESL